MSAPALDAAFEQTGPEGPTDPADLAPASNVRWIVCALLFFATTINYIDRQILALIKEFLDHELRWTNEQFGLVNSAFNLSHHEGPMHQRPHRR